jgi:hypothetical protein
MHADLTPRESAVLLYLAKTRVLSKLRDNTLAHKAADAHLDAMTVAVMYSFLRGRKAYKSGGINAAVKAVRDGLLKSLPPVLLKTVAAGGNAAIAKVPKHRAAMRALKPQRPGQPHSSEPPFNLQFNATDEAAIAWAKQHAAELAKDLSETSRDRIKDAVARATEGDGIEAAYDDILDAVGDETRADMIARTETMWAMAEGQQQGWEQAAEAGLLDDDQQVVWIATSGCCDDCDEMDGETRPLNGEYDDPDYADGPPAHPNCRCTEGIAG